ncbi:Zn-dependent exopeptidase [Hysterangium stoloniferum]|nr:Zn-dependent exopeptidase [Hysterangium stoloniferum]
MIAFLFLFASLLSSTIIVESTPVLFVTPGEAVATKSTDECLSHLGLYGTNGDTYNVYRSSLECGALQSLDTAHLLPIQDKTSVVYIQEAGVDESIRGDEPEFSEALDKLVMLFVSYSERVHDSQSVFAINPDAFVLHRTPSSALISIPDVALSSLDTVLPRFFVPVLLPTLAAIPVPSKDVNRVSGWLSDLHFEADISSLIGDLSVDEMRNDIRYLTGEDESSPIVSRQSFTTGARKAANWIKARFEDTGGDCELRPFSFGYAPNVVCKYPAVVNTTGTIILSGHYDSRGSFGSTRAPGGNDDGSGVLSILGIARTIKNKGIKFHTNVELVAFAGEEQGLVGSRAYAKELREADANVTLMIQADMIAYHKPGEPAQLGLPDRIGTAEVAQLVANVSALYSPELSVGLTSACCSDHQSFHEQGYAATQVFERAGAIADPMYHNSRDLSDREGYDFEQIRSIAKVTFATLLHTAGFRAESI